MCLLKGHNYSNWCKLDISKGAYWTKMCLLTKKMSVKWKDAYWIKMCLLNENVSIDQKGACWMEMYLLTTSKKCVYWLKGYLLNENVPINQKYAYWIKRCLLNGHNLLGINSGLYSLGNFFSFIFQKTYGSSPNLLFVEPNKLSYILGTNL